MSVYILHLSLLSYGATTRARAFSIFDGSFYTQKYCQSFNDLKSTDDLVTELDEIIRRINVISRTRARASIRRNCTTWNSNSNRATRADSPCNISTLLSSPRVSFLQRVNQRKEGNAEQNESIASPRYCRHHETKSERANRNPLRKSSTSTLPRAVLSFLSPWVGLHCCSPAAFF